MQNLLKQIPLLRRDKQSWYSKPEMYGHISAKKNVEALAETAALARTPKQVYLIKSLIPDTKEWHPFHAVSTASISRAKHVIKAIEKQPAIEVASWYSQRSSMWRDDMSRALDVLAYQENPIAAGRADVAHYMSMGLPEQKAKDRYANLIKGFVEKVGVPVTGGAIKKGYRKGKRGGMFRLTPKGKTYKKK